MLIRERELFEWEDLRRFNDITKLSSKITERLILLADIRYASAQHPETR